MINAYRSADKNVVLELLRLNTPKYFDSIEETDFVKYLDNELEDYFVVEMNGVVVGCGGINYLPEEAKAVIAWDIIHPDHHGQGIGMSLLKHRLEKIKNNPKYHKVIVRTSQFAHGFYRKGGFKLIKTVDDFWAKGIHLYQMEMVFRNEQIHS